MKHIIIFLLLSASLNAGIDSVIAEKMRLKYYQALEDENALEELENFIIRHFNKDENRYPPLVLAYKGGIEALKGKHAFNPFNKLSYLLSGLNLLETAVEKNPDNLEIRFMRFSILHYVPGIIGFGSEREDDKNKIISLITSGRNSGLADDITKGIINFMLSSGRLSSAEESKLDSFDKQL